MSFSIVVDHAQRRLKRDRVALTAAGLDFNGDVWSNTYIDPVKNVLMLKPASLFDDYHASNSGMYAKLGLSDFNPGIPSQWTEQAHFAGDGNYIMPKATATLPFSNEIMFTDSGWDKNRGIVISLFGYNAGNDGKGIVDIGWSTDPLGNTGPGFKIFGRRVDFYLDDTFQKTVTLSGGRSGQNVNKQYLDITILPFRKREYLILDSMGGAAVIVRDDISEDEEDPILIPADPFWFFYRNGRPNIQVAKLSFPASGYATTVNGQFGTAPASGSSREPWDNDAPAVGVTDFRVLGDPPYAASGTFEVDAVKFVETDGSTPFTPDGTARDCRIRVELTSTEGTHTPYVYATHGAYEADFADTDGSEDFDLTGRVMAEGNVTIEIPDSPTCSFTFTVDDPEGLETDVAQFVAVSQRPMKLILDGLTLIDGMNDPVELTDAAFGENRRGKVRVEHRFSAMLKRYVFRERVPFDGMDLSRSDPANASAVQFVLSRAGILDSEMDLEELDFKIPEIPGQGGEFNWLAEVGDTAEQVLDRLRSNFAASFRMGPKPTADGDKYLFRDPDTLGDTPVLSLYRTLESAYAGKIAEGMSAEDATLYAYQFLYGEGPFHGLDVEANEVRVTGYDPRLDRPVGAYYVDTDAQDPTLAPSDRPENWTGFPVVMGVLDPRVTTEEAAQRCVNYLVPIVTKRRYAGEVPCGAWPWYMVDDQRVPLWTGDVVTLEERGDYVVTAMSATLEAEDHTEDWSARSVRLTLMKVGTGTPSMSGAKNLANLRHLSRDAARNKLIRRPGWEKLSRFGFGTIVAA